MSTDHASIPWKIVGIIVYAIVSSLVGMWVMNTLQEEDGLHGGKHADEIRSCIVTPRGESLDDIGGMEDIKRELYRSVLLPLRHPDIFYRGPKSLRPPKGILLHGPPGTGKTMLARALASEVGVPFLSLTASSLESKWWGESPKLIESAFKLARGELAPCIVFFDEIDGIGRRRNELDQSCVYSFKTELLRNLDGVDNDADSPVMVLACTNAPDSLDPALRRRLPHTVHVGKPDARARYSILRRLLKEEATVDKSVVRAVAQKTEGFTGSDLSALFARASAIRFREFAMEDVLASGTIRSGTELVQKVGGILAPHWDRAIAATTV